MLAERLNEVALDLESHAESESLVSELENVLTSVQQLRQAQQPNAGGNPQKIRQQLQRHLEKLYRKLEADPSNEYPPTLVSILQEIGGWEVTGVRLRSEVEQIFDAPALEGEQVETELENLLEETRSFYDSLDSLLSAFRSLEVDRSTPPTGECAEVGIAYPAPGENEQLDLETIYTELSEWRDHLRWFAEVGGVTPGKVHVRAIGSSGWEVFIESPYGQAAMIAITIERCLMILNEVADLKAKWDEVLSAGTTREVDQKTIEDDARAKKEKLKEDLVEDLLEVYPGDSGRANEMRMPLREAVDFVLEKAREGGTVEVRIIPPADDEEEEEISPGMGTASDLQRRGRAMAGEAGEGLFLPKETVELLRSVAEPQEASGAEDEDDETDETDDGERQADNENEASDSENDETEVSDDRGR